VFRKQETHDGTDQVRICWTFALGSIALPGPKSEDKTFAIDLSEAGSNRHAQYSSTNYAPGIHYS